MNPIHITSEVKPLRRVLVKSPIVGLNFVTPSNMEEMLIDDIVDHNAISNEHKKLVDFFKTQKIQVIEQEQLLRDILSDMNIRGNFLGYLFGDFIAKKLIGFSVNELVHYIYNGVPPTHSNVKMLVPIVNNMFTRDPGVILGNHYLSGRATYDVRKREFSLTEALFKFHRDYAALKHIDYVSDGTIEGGDIQVISQNIVLIGVSERTSLKTIQSLKEHIFSIGFKYVIAVDLPKRRSAMHLDTVFTMVDEAECVVYPPFIIGSEQHKPSNVVVFSQRDSETKSDLISALSDIGLTLNVIFCGGENSINQEREQWTDGANCLSIAPGHAIIYNRNRETIKAFEKAGYIYVSADSVYAPLPREHKFIIGIDGFELSRARGGSHCLTFPILRV